MFFFFLSFYNLLFLLCLEYYHLVVEYVIVYGYVLKLKHDMAVPENRLKDGFLIVISFRGSIWAVDIL